MANGFPPSREAILVTFTQNFAAKGSASPTTYSLTAAQMVTYSTLSNAFVDAYLVASDKATRSPMNITLKDTAKRALIDNLRLLAKIIQNSPTTTNAMRDDLGLPQRGLPPTPVPSPGTAYKFKVTLGSTGALTFTWKCNNPSRSSGTMYQIFRRIGTAGDPVYVGGTGVKRFVDNTIPAGTATATYHVQAIRSTGVGEWAILNVNFGVNGGTTSAEEVTPVKRAA